MSGLVFGPGRFRHPGAAPAFGAGGGGIPPAFMPAESGDYVLWSQRLQLSPDSSIVNGSTTLRLRVNQIFLGFANFNVTDARFGFPNFYYTSTAPAEAVAPDARTVDILACAVFSGNPEAGGTKLGDVLFSGSTSVSIQPGDFLLSDASAFVIPADTPIFMRLLVDHNLNNGRVPIGWTRQRGNGEKIQTFAIGALSTATALVNGGAMTDNPNTTTSSIFKGYAPMCAIGRGWDGRDAYLLFGHSLVHGGNRSQATTDAADPRGNRVAAAMALDSADRIGGRATFGNFAVPGITMQQIGQTAENPDFFYRAKALNAIRALNGGRMPFTRVFCDIANNGAPTTFEEWRDALRANIAWMRQVFGAEVPIDMPTVNPRTTDTTTLWSTLEAQGFASSRDGPGPDAPRQQLAAYIAANEDLGLRAALDIRAVSTADNGAKFPVSGFFSSTLASDATAGASSVSLHQAPERGMCLVFREGGLETKAAVATVTGTGPYTVSFTEGVRLTSAHAAGELVAEAATADGLHTSVKQNARIAAAMVDALNGL